MAIIGLLKRSGKRLKVREKSVKSQGVLKWILSGNPVLVLSHHHLPHFVHVSSKGSHKPALMCSLV